MVGPGWEGILIVSTNARRIPSITVERNYTDAFRTRWLRWLGPWRVSASRGQLERSDVAVPDARFFTARLNFRPATWLEFGLSRTAQWCGESRPCDLSTFGELLIGRDNRDASLLVSREPGNQMAGYDLRLRSPWRALPAALCMRSSQGSIRPGDSPASFSGCLARNTGASPSWARTDCTSSMRTRAAIFPAGRLRSTAPAATHFIPRATPIAGGHRRRPRWRRPHVFGRCAAGAA